MAYFALIVFIVTTAVHLYASLKKNQKLRNCTKPFILAALLAFYVLRAGVPSLAIILALILSWLGDVLLMPKGMKWFTAGGIAFMASHLCFIWGYCGDISAGKVSLIWMLLMEVFFLIVVAIVFSKLKPFLPKKLFYPMALYLLINGTMNCFALLRLISNPCTAAIITAVGAVLFFISDCSLFFVRFNRNSRLKTHFLVMLTYSVGELLIVIGLL